MSTVRDPSSGLLYRHRSFTSSKGTATMSLLSEELAPGSGISPKRPRSREAIAIASAAASSPPPPPLLSSSLPSPSSSSLGAVIPPRPSEVTFYVGRNRAKFVLSAETLHGSSYFRSLIMSHRQAAKDPPPIVVDCEESVFQNILDLLRYGSFEALPKLSEAEMFKLKRELKFFGVQVAAEIVTTSTKTLNPSLNPSQNSRFPSLRELAEFPPEIADPAKLVLISRLDNDPRGRCSFCDEKLAIGNYTTQWALNFHHHHAFCTGCGTAAAPSMVPKCFAEMFMTAALYYCAGRSDNSAVNWKRWSVSSDSTCTLRFISCSPPAPSCPNCPNITETSWGASLYHSHAFCTSCGSCANGPTLTSILLLLRFRGAGLGIIGGANSNSSPNGNPTSGITTSSNGSGNHSGRHRRGSSMSLSSSGNSGSSSTDSLIALATTMNHNHNTYNGYGGKGKEAPSPNPNQR